MRWQTHSEHLDDVHLRGGGDEPPDKLTHPEELRPHVCSYPPMCRVHSHETLCTQGGGGLRSGRPGVLGGSYHARDSCPNLTHIASSHVGPWAYSIVLGAGEI